MGEADREAQEAAMWAALEQQRPAGNSPSRSPPRRSSPPRRRSRSPPRRSSPPRRRSRSPRRRSRSPPRRREEEHTVFVGNLSFDTSEAELRREFQHMGDLTRVRLMTNREDGKSRGFAFVSFSDHEAVAKCMDRMDGSTIDGRQIRVDAAGGKGGKGGKAGGAPRDEPGKGSKGSKGGKGGKGGLPQLYEILQGEVQSVQEYGAFVRMFLPGGGTRDGLVHKSQLADYYWANVEDVVSAGQQVWVKVAEITEDPERGTKIGLSMAVVNQSDGTDQDPGNSALMAALESILRPGLG